MIRHNSKIKKMVLLPIVLLVSLFIYGVTFAVELHDNFPILSEAIPGKLYNAITAFDYDRDGNIELLFGSGGLIESGLFYAISEQGIVELEYSLGFSNGGILTPVSVADIDADGQFELAFGGIGPEGYGYLIILNADGSLQAAVNLTMQLGFAGPMGSPAIDL